MAEILGRVSECEELDVKTPLWRCGEQNVEVNPTEKAGSSAERGGVLSGKEG